jgi:hypothetical protein
MKFGNLNFLEPSGPLQACNGTAFMVIIVYISWNNKSVFDIIDARCKHEDRNPAFFELLSL